MTMKTLTDIDSIYRSSIATTFETMKQVEKEVLSSYKFDTSKMEITDAIIKRLKIYYETQTLIKNHLEKRYVAAASDFFVESVLFYLRLYLRQESPILKVCSERQIKATKNAIRPDISVWSGNDVIAIIECKTQLGWSRNNWEQEFTKREKKLTSEYPNAKSFLLVMTGENWSGFGDHEKLNESFFCLLNDCWPVNYKSVNEISTPIEGLFKQIGEH